VRLRVAQRKRHAHHVLDAPIEDVARALHAFLLEAEAAVERDRAGASLA